MKNLVETIKNGGLVAVPTETVYGLACNGLDEIAVDKVYKIKGRPEIKPLSLMVHDLSWIDRFCTSVPQIAYSLAAKFWPGPLTIILKSKDLVPEIVRAGGLTVGLRCPDNNLTLSLIEEVDLPLAAPSANPSGKPSAKNAEQVFAYFGDDVEILDGGECSIGIESTIIDLSSVPYRILRPGAISSDILLDEIVSKLNIVGLTGQSGSGKSVALKALQDNDFYIIDCDQVYHDLLESDSDMLSELYYAFPDAFSNGKIDRVLLSKEVFTDSSSLLQLNSITHKYVLKKVKELLSDFALYGGHNAAVEAAELISSGIGALCDKIIGVVADDSTRINRIMERDGISYRQAEERIKAQKNIQYFKDNCDLIIENNNSVECFLNNILKEVVKNG